MQASVAAPLPLKFDPENLNICKRHTKILGTLSKKTSNEMLREYIFIHLLQHTLTIYFLVLSLMEWTV